MSDPPHYTSHPSGVECIQITEHMNFNLGNAVKYIWRAGEKGAVVEDLKKARWYLDREISRIGGKPRPTIAELEAILASEPSTDVQIMPDGSVRTLDPNADVPSNENVL